MRANPHHHILCQIFLIIKASIHTHVCQTSCMPNFIYSTHVCVYVCVCLFPFAPWVSWVKGAKDRPLQSYGPKRVLVRSRPPHTIIDPLYRSSPKRHKGHGVDPLRRTHCVHSILERLNSRLEVHASMRKPKGS